MRVVIAALFAALLACVACRRHESRAAVNQPFTVKGVVVDPDTLDAAARRIVDFLRGKASFDQINLSDTVTLSVAPEGGGGQATFARQGLGQPSAWRVRSGGHVYSFAPPTEMTKLTTKVGRHFSCNEQSLATRFPRFAKFPHVGTLLEPAIRSSCLQTWNVTFVFDTSSPPRLVAAVYDQWEW